MATRRDFIKGIIGMAGLSLAGPLMEGCAVIGSKIKDSAPTYNTIAHDFLDIEEIGVAYSDYQALDEIIYEAERRIELKAGLPYNKRQAVTVLEAIDHILKDKGFEIKEDTLMNKGLKNKELDCDSFSIVYLGIGEVLNLPLKIARIPRHVFVRWHFDEDDYFNWETMHGVERSDEYYKKRGKIDDIPIKKGIFLKSFNREETLAIAYNTKGIALINGFREEEAIKSFDKGVTLNQRYPLLYFNKGVALEKLKRYGEAIESYEKVLEMDPNHASAYYRKESSLYELNRLKIRE